VTASRQFAARLLLAGAEPTAGRIVSFDIDSTRYGRCDTAEIVLAIDTTKLAGGAAWFETLSGDDADIVLQLCDRSARSTSWTTIFHGIVDHVAWAPDDGRLTLECRDYMARLVDMRLQSAWLNLTGAELIAAVVASAFLDASVSMPATMTGQFWQIEHKRSAVFAQHRFQTAFDLASFVAREANCDLYADSKTIVCMPIKDSSDSAAAVIDLSGLTVARSLSRDCQLAQGVVVHVASWDSRQRVATQIYYDGRDYSSQAPSGAGVVHSFRVPGRRLDEVRSIALGKYNRIAAHEVSAHVRLPGQVGFGPRQFVRGVASSGTWAGVLSVDAVRSRFSIEHGFVQDATVRSRSGRAG
jgi:hypothetical protein